MEKCDVLVVDDDDFNLKVAADILQDEFTTCTAQSGEMAIECLQSVLPRLILLDLHMPGMDGRETMKKIRENQEWKKIPIIFLTADSKPETEKECLVLGAADFITKPFVPMVMQSRIRRIMELAELQNDLEGRLEEKTKLVEKVSLNAIMVIANTIDAKDAYTSGHSHRVAKCSEAIARELGWCEEDIQNLHSIALLHDIGKIGVPDAILNKPSRLRDEEFEIIKRHPVIGNDILKDIHIIKNVAEGALYHHERYDGKGYPFGISGEDIPFCARIIGIADAYDAMTSNRVYRRGMDMIRVIEEFKKGRGSQFDPELTDLFLGMLEDKMDSMEDGGFAIWGGDFKDETARLDTVLPESAVDARVQDEIDVLTGLDSRRTAEEKIQRLISDGHFGSLLVIDIDDFHRINDEYGHIAGDRALQFFGETMRVSTRTQDVLCRLGGDEFFVFLTDVTDRSETEKKAVNLKETLAEGLKKLNMGKDISVSIGISVYPDDGKVFEALYACADKALYYVKRNGKNRISFYSGFKNADVNQNTGTDLDHIRSVIEGTGEPIHGAFKVDYADFPNIYNYITRGILRNKQQVQTLLFTLNIQGDGGKASAEEAMKTLELSVASSLRMVDVGTRYSSIQYIVILIDSNLENGRMVAERVIKQFYKMYGGSGVAVTYDIQTMQPRQSIEN